MTNNYQDFKDSGVEHKKRRPNAVPVVMTRFIDPAHGCVAAITHYDWDNGLLPPSPLPSPGVEKVKPTRGAGLMLKRKRLASTYHKAEVLDSNAATMADKGELLGGTGSGVSPNRKVLNGHGNGILITPSNNPDELPSIRVIQGVRSSLRRRSRG